MRAKYALQRRLANRDHARWRIVCEVAENDVLTAMGAVVQLGRISAPVEWRVVRTDDFARPLAHWSRESGWTTTDLAWERN